MIIIDEETISEYLDYIELIRHLKQDFSEEKITVPQRLHLQLPSDNISLVMPAWNEKYYGLKQIIACPNNPKNNLATIQGKYDLFNVLNGKHLAQINAAKLTAIRTSATSVLASSFLKKQARNLLILGAGVIAEEMIKAYAAQYQLDKILIWNRTTKNAEKLVSKYHNVYPVEVSTKLETEADSADIITCVTHTNDPILHGDWISKNPHIDLVGSYKTSMREADDALVKKSEIYIDHDNAKSESGDLFIPLQKGIINTGDINGTLFQLCKGTVIPKDSNKPTLFKSVGHALEDLSAAIYLYEKMNIS